MSVSRVGLGCASAWGQPWLNEQQALAIVHRALELGVRTFDTGPSYSGGHAEPRLGRALKGRDLDGVLISTKVGTHLGRYGRLFHDLGRAAVIKSVDDSRRRLGLDRIPLLYLHGPWAGELDQRLTDMLEELRDRGWVAAFGVNSYDPVVIERAATLPVFTTFMVDYNLLRIEREPLVAALHKAGHRVVSGSALANHLHAPRFLRPRRLQDVWYVLRLLKNYRHDWRVARRLRFLKETPGWSPAQLALAFVLENPDVDVAMFGTTRLEHLEENLSMLDTTPPPEVLTKVRVTLAVPGTVDGDR